MNPGVGPGLPRRGKCFRGYGLITRASGKEADGSQASHRHQGQSHRRPPHPHAHLPLSSILSSCEFRIVPPAAHSRTFSMPKVTTRQPALHDIPWRISSRSACSFPGRYRDSSTSTEGSGVMPASLGTATRSKPLAVLKAQVATDALCLVQAGSRRQTALARSSIGWAEVSTTFRRRLMASTIVSTRQSSSPAVAGARRAITI